MDNWPSSMMRRQRETHFHTSPVFCHADFLFWQPPLKAKERIREERERWCSRRGGGEVNSSVGGSTYLSLSLVAAAAAAAAAHYNSSTTTKPTSSKADGDLHSDMARVLSCAIIPIWETSERRESREEEKGHRVSSSSSSSSSSSYEQPTKEIEALPAAF